MSFVLQELGHRPQYWKNLQVELMMVKSEVSRSQSYYNSFWGGNERLNQIAV